MRKIVTVSREFGSGGREIGKRLAESLNLKYYDSAIVEALSEQTNLDVGYLNEKLDGGINHFATVAHSFSRVAAVRDNAMLLAKQHGIIKQLANENDCVIVGRGADAVLNDLKPFRIFVYADISSKIARCKNRMNGDEALSDKEIERRIKSIDKNRKTTHDLYSAYSWGDKAAYDLCINTSNITIENIIPAVAEIINGYFGDTEK